MFWKLTFRPPSAIDTLLNEEQCSLNDILDEDNVLQELKSQNKKLVDFFVQPEILEQLVKLVTLKPDDDAEDKVKFKYPHLSCELLTCDVEAIVNSLSESEQFMGMLWAFLDRKEPLNPLLGSFTSTVLNMLLIQKCTIIFDYVRDKEDFVTLFLNHLGTSAIMDLLLQMVAVPSNDQCRVDMAQWFKEQGVVERLVDLIHPEIDTKKCANASQTLCDMIRVSRESRASMAGPAPLLETLESDVTMKRLLENMFCADIPSDVVLVSGVNVLLTAIERRQPNALSPSMNSTFMGDEISTNNVQAIKEILGVIIPRMKLFNDLLVRPPNVPALVTTVGRLDPPLGSTRLQVVKLFCALLQCNDARVNKQVAELHTFSILMDLFFKFPWNNFLHSQVESCVSAAVSTAAASHDASPPNAPAGTPPNHPTSTPTDCSVSITQALESKKTGDNSNGTTTDDSFSLLYHVLHDCHLVQRLLEGDEDNQRRCSEPHGQRQGYMGHLMKMVNLLMHCGEVDLNLAVMLKDTMEEGVQQKWNSFLSGTVADTNKKNETNLGGNRPLTSSMDDSDDDFDQLVPPDNELDKAYQHYQEVKYITTMVDDFGVDDELRSNEELYSGTFTQLMNIGCVVVANEEQSQSASLFEAACAEKIQQFDDSESDEEESSTWADREVTFNSPMDRQSMSSEEDDNTNRQREFQTSFEDDSTKSSHHSVLSSTASPNTLAQITTKSSDDSDKMDISSPYNATTTWQSPEDLSGVTPMDTGAGTVQWTSEPRNDTPPSPQSNWADFSSFTTQRSPDVIGASPDRVDPKTSPSGAVDVDNIELTVMDDINSPESPKLSVRSRKNNDSSDEEGDDSSSPEEDRSGRYVLNTSSDGEHLLESPGQSPQQPSPNTNKSISDRLPSNGVGVNAPSQTEVSSEQPQLTNTTTQTTTTTSNSHDHLNDGGHNRVAATGQDNTDLSDNFDFLAKQGLLHDDSESLTDEQLLEKKRMEALEACKQYDEEVQDSQGVDIS